MARLLTLRAEIARGLDDAGPEKRLPVTIHRDACGQRVGGRDEPLGQSEPIRGAPCGSGGRLLETSGETLSPC